MANSRSPYCTGLPFSTYALTTSPSYPDVISFISFIASMMQRTWSFFTRCPISTNEARPAPGTGRRCRRSGTSPRRAPPTRSRRPLGAAAAAGPGPAAAARRTGGGGDGRAGRRHHLHGSGVERRARRPLSARAASIRHVPARIPRGRASARARGSVRCQKSPIQLPALSSQLPCRVKTSQPVCGHQYVVFNPHAADARDVGARLDREDHARLDDLVGSPGTGGRSAAPRALRARDRALSHDRTHPPVRTAQARTGPRRRWRWTPRPGGRPRWPLAGPRRPPHTVAAGLRGRPQAEPYA